MDNVGVVPLGHFEFVGHVVMVLLPVPSCIILIVYVIPAIGLVIDKVLPVPVRVTKALIPLAAFHVMVPVLSLNDWTV